MTHPLKIPVPNFQLVSLSHAQLSSLNASVWELRDALRSAPELTGLPARVDGLAGQLAQLGAQLADVRSQLKEEASAADREQRSGRVRFDHMYFIGIVFNYAGLDIVYRSFTNVNGVTGNRSLF